MDKSTSLFSEEGTGIAGEATGRDVPVVIKDVELLEATVVMEVGGLLRPGLVVLWLLLLVGEGGCCFFFTACKFYKLSFPVVPQLQVGEKKGRTYLFKTDWTHPISCRISIEATAWSTEGWRSLHVGFLFHLSSDEGSWMMMYTLCRLRNCRALRQRIYESVTPKERKQKQSETKVLW